MAKKRAVKCVEEEVPNVEKEFSWAFEFRYAKKMSLNNISETEDQMIMDIINYRDGDFLDFEVRGIKYWIN